MRCRLVQRHLADHIDGSLAGSLAWQIEKHLVECHECSRIHHEIELTLAAVRGLNRPSAPPDLRATIRAQVSRPVLNAPSASRHRSTWPWALAAALMGLAVWSGMNGTRFGGHAGHPTEPLAVSARQAAQSARAQSVALAAADPLDDVAAANLAGHPPGRRDSL